MRQNEHAVRRSRGRPPIRSDEETRHLILEAASLEFRANGYASTTMSAVGQRAGVSTKTMYRLIPTKADLFKSMCSERIGRFMLAIDETSVGTLELEAALERILGAYGNLALDGEVIAITRLVTSESDRFPELGSAFYEGAFRRTREAIESWLRLKCHQGLIALDDPGVAADMLRGMMIMEPQRAVMLGQRPAPDAEEIAARASMCARLFLNGCRSIG
ncbi:TetR family transcriptional regulator (plasmid) [Microvirga ossetica]|uniref:TetR family transcriptional regulator n=1 Tax=Microvirga ossetica TaxID=1882682 RepID=A0A1B2ETG8_9HYPH|nr:TetR/AcrR family transcriptional regulator [Microvirga ossetica]ANY83274.1 TetR family transcriptional regulator [Microvirga ossetica]